MTTLQNQVLSILQASAGDYVSGEGIAARLHVSRAAVFKAVRALRQSGYPVEALRKCGYCLPYAPEELCEERIQALLREAGHEVSVRVFSSIDSTNSEGKRTAQELTQPLLIAAETQTAGRGRQGHSFYSPAHTGLYMTIVAPTALPYRTVALCTQMMAVAAVQVLENLGSPEISIKWVNDLYYCKNKIAGILTEAVSDLEARQVSAVVCGIGINLTTAVFPEEIREKAGSVGRLERNQLAAGIASMFLDYMSLLPDVSPWMPFYRQRSMVLGKPLSFTRDHVLYHGVGSEIDDEGRLRVELAEGGSVWLDSGEISIVPDQLA